MTDETVFIKNVLFNTISAFAVMTLRIQTNKQLVSAYLQT